MPKMNNGSPVFCDCGKLVAIERDGVIYVKCKRCNRQVPVFKELRAQEVESH